MFSKKVSNLINLTSFDGVYIYEWLCTDTGALAYAFFEHKIIGPVFFSHFIMPGLYPPPPPTHTHTHTRTHTELKVTILLTRVHLHVAGWSRIRLQVWSSGETCDASTWQPEANLTADIIRRYDNPTVTAEQTANGLTVLSSALCGFLRHHAVLRIYFVLRCEMHNI